MGNGLRCVFCLVLRGFFLLKKRCSADFDTGRALFDQKKFRESVTWFEKEWVTLSKAKQLESEDGVSLCQFLGTGESFLE